MIQLFLKDKALTTKRFKRFQTKTGIKKAKHVCGTT